MTSAPASRSPRTSSRGPLRRRRRERQAVPLAASGHQQMTLRRAPNIWAFVVLGGVLGIVVGMVVGALGSGNPQFTPGTVILFMVSVFVIVGLAAGAVVALVLERISVSLARSVTTEVVAEDVRTAAVDEDLPAEDGTGGAAAAGTGSEAGEGGAPARPGEDGDARPTDPRSSREG